MVAPAGLPALALTPTGFRAVSMEAESARLKHRLNQEGIEVNSWIGKYPVVALCVLDDRNQRKILDKCRGFTTVITLCCEAGRKSIESMMPDCRIISGMDARGIVNARVKSRMLSTRLYVEKKSVTITPFTLET